MLVYLWERFGNCEKFGVAKKLEIYTTGKSRLYEKFIDKSRLHVKFIGKSRLHEKFLGIKKT